MSWQLSGGARKAIAEAKDLEVLQIAAGLEGGRLATLEQAAAVKWFVERNYPGTPVKVARDATGHNGFQLVLGLWDGEPLSDTHLREIEGVVDAVRDFIVDEDDGAEEKDAETTVGAEG